MIFGQNATSYGWIDFLHLVRSRWSLILLAGSLVFLGGAALRGRAPLLHEAVARIGLDSPQDASEPTTVEPDFRRAGQNRLIRAAAELKSNNLLSEVTGPLGLSSRWQIPDGAKLRQRLESRVRVEIRDEEETLLVAARDHSPEHAAALANAIADRFISRKDSEARAEANALVRRLEQDMEDRAVEIESIEASLIKIAGAEDSEPGASGELRRRLVSTRNLIHSLEAKHQLAILEADKAGTAARLVAPASPDRAVSMRSMWLSLPGLFFIGLFSGVGIVFGASILLRKGRWDAVSDLVAQLQIHFAGFAPLSGSSALAAGEFPDEMLEPYRDLRNRLLRLPAGDCLLLTMMPLRKTDPSAEAIVNLAAVLADAGRTTLVIDADFRTPQLHPYFDAAHHPGLSDYLSGEMRLEETVIRSRRANLWFMPAGPLHDDPGGLLNGRRMDDLVWDMRSRFDFILIASPSIHEVSDAGLLAALADFTAVVVPYAGHSLRWLRETQVALELANAALSGVVLTAKSAHSVNSGKRVEAKANLAKV